MTRHLPVLLFPLSLALLTSGCVDGEITEGAQVTIEISAQAPDNAHLPDHLMVVVDHVELLSCTPALPHLMSHLPATPYRLSSGELWEVVIDGTFNEPLTLGTLEPIPEDYCGARLGIYSALPDSPAVHSGFTEGLSFQARWDAPSEVQVNSSLGFDIEDRGSPWITADTLRATPLTILFTLQLPEHPIDDPRALAEYLVAHSTITLITAENL